MPKCGGKVTAL